jgi:hypothetical protein
MTLDSGLWTADFGLRTLDYARQLSSFKIPGGGV